jgi:hypothetical protein
LEPINVRLLRRLLRVLERIERDRPHSTFPPMVVPQDEVNSGIRQAIAYDNKQYAKPVTPSATGLDVAVNQKDQEPHDADPTNGYSGPKQADSSPLYRCRSYIRRIRDESRPQEHLTLVFTCVIALSTFAYTIFAGWQLYEIHSGSEDTHALAVASQRQARAALAQVQAVLSQTQIQTKSLEYSERPWLTAKASVAGPLIIDEYGNVFMWISFRFTNVGHSPAYHVWYEAGMAAFTGDAHLEPVAVQSQVCSGAINGDKRRNTFSGWTIFPNQSKESIAGIRIRANDIPHAVIRRSYPAGLLVPAAVGCVDYQFGFEAGHHQTGFVYEIFADRPILPTNRDSEIPRRQLRLGEGVLTGGIEAN